MSDIWGRLGFSIFHSLWVSFLLLFKTVEGVSKICFSFQNDGKFRFDVQLSHYGTLEHKCSQKRGLGATCNLVAPCWLSQNKNEQVSFNKLYKLLMINVCHLKHLNIKERRYRSWLCNNRFRKCYEIYHGSDIVYSSCISNILMES